MENGLKVGDILALFKTIDEFATVLINGSDKYIIEFDDSMSYINIKEKTA